MKKPKEPKEPKKPREPKKPKEPKEKKPKKQKAPKEKKPRKPKKGQAPEEGQEGGKKKKKPLILLLIPLAVVIAAAAIVVFVILPGRKGADEPDAEVSVAPLPPSLPPDYQVGDQTVAGMTLDADESEAKAALTRVVYTYTDLADAGKAAETYVDQLTAANPRFYVVDEDFVRTDEPDFTTLEGTVLMARDIVVATPEPSAAPVESEAGGEDDASAQPTQTPAPSQPPAEETPGMVLAVKMEWSKGQCVVTADQEEGKVTSRPPSQQQGAAGGGGMGQRAAKEYLEGLEPAQLGLEGQSMDDYEVMVVDGIVLVSGEPCTKLNIYDEDYVFMGCYLVAQSGQELYQLDTVTGTITVMKMP